MILSLELMLLGFVTLLYVLFVTIIAWIMIAKYFKVKRKSILYAGISSTGLAAAWSGIAFNFISVVFFDIIPPIEFYFLLHGCWLPLSNFFWVLTGITLSRLKKKMKKRLTIVFGIIYIILEIMYTIFLFTDTTILGTPMNEIQVDYAPFSELYLLFILTMITIIGFWIANESLKSEDKRIRLKGKLLFISFTLFAFAAVLEVLIPIIPVLVMARILVMFCAILLYGGFFLPKWMEKLFLKEK